MIELILLERVEKLGQMGQLVKVKPGFARNYLLPQKKAMRASKENLAYFETQRAQLEATNLQRKSEAAEIAGKLEGLSAVLVRQIAGQIARRIVTDGRPGDQAEQGGRMGMIRFGSRVDVFLPRTSPLAVRVAVGDRVHAGTSVLAEYAA